MAASYVGSAGGANGSDFSATLTFNTTRTIAAGERVVVCMYTSPTVASVTVGALSLTSTGFANWMWSGHAASQINSGATVTVTLNAETSAGNKRAIADVISGIDSSSPIRATTSNTGFGSTPSSGATDATPQAGDLSFAMVQPGASTVTGAGSGLTLGNTTLTALQTGYEVLGSSGADTGSFTISPSDDWTVAMVVFKAASGGGTSATVDLDTGNIVAGGTAASTAPPRPRPAHPYSEINLRM